MGAINTIPHLKPAWATMVLFIVGMRLTMLLADQVPVKLVSGSISFLFTATLVFAGLVALANRTQKHLKPKIYFALAITLSILFIALPRITGPPYWAPLTAIRDLYFILVLPVLASLYANSPKDS